MRQLVLFLFLIPFLTSCDRNNVEVDNSLGSFFDENGVHGTFALYNNGTDHFTIYNLSRYRDSAYLPASTFKIVNSLIGLQYGVITNDSMVIKWDGIQRPVAEWDQDLSMYEAFRVSAVPYYQEVARRIGKDSMQKALDTLGYAGGLNDTTYIIRSSIDTFWLDNSLRITPDENLGLVRKLYFGELPFFRSNQQIVKRAMLFEDNSNYKLSYKTGWGREGNKHIGWMVGWIEENDHPYFFVLNFDSDKQDFNMVDVRMKILKGILQKLGFMQGKM